MNFFQYHSKAQKELVDFCFCFQNGLQTGVEVVAAGDGDEHESDEYPASEDGEEAIGGLVVWQTTERGAATDRRIELSCWPRCAIICVPMSISTPGTEAKNLLTSEAQEE